MCRNLPGRRKAENARVTLGAEDRMTIARRLMVIVFVIVGLVAIPGVANAATMPTTVRMTTSEVDRQSPTNIGRLQAAGGAVIITASGEQLGQLHGSYRVDLSGLQCSFVERSDTITFRFSATDTLRVVASGSDISTDGCLGRRFHRVLSWRVTGGTGQYAGVTGNGTAAGSLKSAAGIDYATSTLSWHGTLVGLTAAVAIRA
jgi:hypothetical protein